MRYLLTASILLYSIFSFSQKKDLQSSFVKKLPVPHKAVNDFGRFLTSNERTTLEIELKSYLKRSSNAIVIVTLDSLTDPITKQEYTVEEAARLYFNTWGIGDSIKNNGVLLLASRKPRRVRIEVGRGLGAVLTDNYCQGVIDDNLVPAFKNGNFFTGFKDAITALENRLDNPAAPQADVEPAAQPAAESFTTIVHEQTTSGIGDMFMAFGTILGGISVFIFIVIIATMRMWLRVPAGFFSRGGYQRHGFLSSNDDDDRWHNNNDNSSDSSSSFFSSSSDSSFSSSSSSSSDSYSGGSSSGGGASGSW